MPHTGSIMLSWLSFIERRLLPKCGRYSRVKSCAGGVLADFASSARQRSWSLTLTRHTGLLRSRDTHARVTFVELFFDLVFVFAVTQLSHTLLENLSLGGALRTLFLLLAVWWVWMYTCWVTNWIDPDKPAV